MVATSRPCEELYRELKHLLPTATIESYTTRDWLWKREVLETDLELIQAHRREAGAPDPDPVDLKKVLPELQRSFKGEQETRNGEKPPPKSSGAEEQAETARKLPGSARPPLPAGRPPALTPKEPSEPPPKFAQEGSGQLLVRSFIVKHQLEETATKLLLSRVPPAQRVEAMKTFQPKGKLRMFAQLEFHLKNLDRAGRAPQPITRTVRSVPKPAARPIISAVSRTMAAAKARAGPQPPRTAPPIPAPRTPPRSPDRRPSTRPSATGSSYRRLPLVSSTESSRREPSRLPAQPAARPASARPAPPRGPPPRPAARPSSAAAYSRLSTLSRPGAPTVSTSVRRPREAPSWEPPAKRARTSESFASGSSVRPLAKVATRPAPQSRPGTTPPRPSQTRTRPGSIISRLL